MRLETPTSGRWPELRALSWEQHCKSTEPGWLARHTCAAHGIHNSKQLAKHPLARVATNREFKEPEPVSRPALLCSCQITGWMDDITGSQSCQYVAQRLCKLWIDWLRRGKALGCSDLSSSFANQLRQGLAGKTGSPFAFSDRAPNNSLLVQHLQSQATLSSDSGPSNAWKTCESDTASRKLTQPTIPRKIPLFCFSS